MKQYKTIEPEFDGIVNKLDKAIEDFRDSFFHALGYRCVYDFKFTGKGKKEEVSLTITHALCVSTLNSRG